MDSATTPASGALAPFRSLRCALSLRSPEMRLVRCSDNENTAMYLWTKREEVVECGAISDNHGMTISNAYRNICSSKTPIKTIKDLSQIKDVGKWILRLMHGFFLDDPPSGASPTKLSTKSKQGRKQKDLKDMFRRRIQWHMPC